MSVTMTPGSAGSDGRFAVIKFIEEPPKQLFVNQWFDVGISILMPRSIASSDTESTCTVDLRPNLFRFTLGETSSQPVSESDNVQLTMNPPFVSFPLSKTGSPSEHVARAKCKIVCSSDQNSKPSAFSIRFHAELDRSIPYEIKPAFSQPLSLVNARLLVESSDWEDIWYKDMGGRDKAILAVATLLDSEGNKVKNRKIPLQLTLLYDNENRTRVAKQDIFRIIGASSYHIDPETGEAPLQFRIEDVSKNHQKQNFIIEVSADKEKCPDIAPAYSRAVCVRSKKKKDQGSRKRPISNDSPSSQKKHAPAVHYQANPPQAQPQPQPLPQPQPEPQFTAPSSEPYMLGSTQNAQQIREAMRGIIKWTEEVVNGLGPLKWNVIGYAQNPDSVIDYKRPYHSMPNPNDKVNQILNMYAENTREHLRVILEAVETSTGHSTNNDSTYGSARRSTTPHSGRSTSVHPSSYSVSNQIPGHSFRPPQWQNTAQEHPSYTMHGLVSHEASAMSPKARQNMPPDQTGTPMPPLHPQPPMQNTYWGQQHGQDIHHAEHGEMSHQRTSDHDEPDMSDIAIDLESRQADVQYVFAKVFKSLQTNLHLGFPAYNIAKELLGFYREGSLSNKSGQFVPIHMHRDEFGPVEMDQASKILKSAILKHSKAVYALKDWDSLSNMVDHALDYELPKDFEGDNPNLFDPAADVGHSGRNFL